MALALTWNSRADLNLKFSEFFNSNHTISVWFMPQFPDSYVGPIVAEAPGPANRPQPAFFLMGTGVYASKQADKMRMALRVGGAENEKQYDKVFQANTWHHLAVVRDGNTFKMFFDGSALGQLTVNSDLPVVKDIPVRLGQTAKWRGVFNNHPTQFYGLIDDLAIFTKALSTREIANLAKPSTKLTGNESGLLAGFPLSKSLPSPASSKLGRKVTLHGQATLVETSSTRDSAKDAKLLPMPSEAFQFSLPVSLHQPLYVGQAPISIGGSHTGRRNFPYDLVPSQLSKTGDVTLLENHKPFEHIPFLALSNGTVDRIDDGIPSGEQDPPATNAMFISIDGMPGYWWKHLHWESGTAKVKVNDKVKAGQVLASIGDSGQAEGNIHHHTLIEYYPDGQSPTDTTTTHEVSVPFAFVDYFVLTRKEDASGTHDTWKHVDIGIPLHQAIANSPPFVLKKDKLKMPTNQDHLLDRKREIEIQKRLARPRKFVTLKD